MNTCRVFLALASISVFWPAYGQEEDPPFPEEARKRLDYAIGKWRSKTQYLDDEGNVARSVVSEDDRRFAIDDRVVEIVGVVIDNGQAFRAWEYFDTQDQKYALTGINRNGMLFTMKGDLGDTFVWESENRISPDGSSTAIRFEHRDFTEKTFTAIGKISKDGGRTWHEFSRQYLERIDD